MDILIESTKKFEDDLGFLKENEKVTTIQKINDYVSRFIFYYMMYNQTSYIINNC